MGGDGGSIPGRQDLVRTKKKPEQAQKEFERVAKWRHCSITQEPLRQPIVACQLGMLYNKESVLEFLIEVEKPANSNCDHIKTLKDIKDLNLTDNPTFQKDEIMKGGGVYNDTLIAEYICPITGLEMNGRYKFGFRWKCGCVFAERALKEIKSDTCHNCGKPFDEDWIILNGSDEDVDLMRTKMEERKARLKAEKKAKKAQKRKLTDSLEQPQTSTGSTEDQKTIDTASKGAEEKSQDVFKVPAVLTSSTKKTHLNKKVETDKEKTLEKKMKKQKELKDIEKKKKDYNPEKSEVYNMIGMSTRKGRKRKIVSSPLRLLDESPIRKVRKSSIDDVNDEVIISKPQQIQKSLSAEFLGKNESDSATSADELLSVSPIATKSFYNKGTSCNYLTPLERKTQRDLFESVITILPERLSQTDKNKVSKSSKKHSKPNRVRKTTSSSKRPSTTRNKKLKTKESQLLKKKSLNEIDPDSQSSQKSETELNSTTSKDSLNSDQGSPEVSPIRDPLRKHVYHKGTPTSKSKRSKVKTTGQFAQKGIQMYVSGLGKGKKSSCGKTARAQRITKEVKKNSFSKYQKRMSSFEDELKIEGIEPLEPVNVHSPKKVIHSPRGSPRKPVTKIDSPDKVKEETQENAIIETPESLSHFSQCPIGNKLVGDATSNKASVKLFPVFTPPTSPSSGTSTPSRSKASKELTATSTPQTVKKTGRQFITKLKDKQGLEQMTLDAGQKQFGALKCQTCGMVYTTGHPEDEADHAQFHKKFLSFVKFPGWKIENILEVFDDGRIIQITENDPKYCKKKVDEVRELVDHELGFPNGGHPCSPSSRTLLFISIDNKVAGCLIAEEIKEGYRVIPESTQEHTLKSAEEEVTDEKQKAWCCSNKAEPVVCGVSRIWSSVQMRRRNIASRMVDSLRMNYIFGTTLSKDDIAFSDPTPDGKIFASSYCGTKSFLVYKYQ
ncbi:uncharacterized protein [Antedon mediterranea]|uniref:uncharacterized protein n=1 Tax=Antedon mediterranea TaxID=105859 RepID=UPI003AF6EAEC